VAAAAPVNQVRDFGFEPLEEVVRKNLKMQVVE